MGGLCLAGLQMMNEVRRTATDQSQDALDFGRDQMFDDLSRPGVAHMTAVDDNIQAGNGR